MNLLDLPFDIRYQLYRHLFPPSLQIYIAVFPDGLGFKALPADSGARVPTELLLTCRDLSVEAREFLYNHYLFNIIGSKRDCLANYQSFVDVVKRYAREEVHVYPFSNGVHSSTACISIVIGSARIDSLNRRGRGVLRSIQEMEAEITSTLSLGPIINSNGALTWRTLSILLMVIGYITIGLLSYRLDAYWNSV